MEQSDGMEQPSLTIHDVVPITPWWDPSLYLNDHHHIFGWGGKASGSSIDMSPSQKSGWNLLALGELTIPKAWVHQLSPIIVQKHLSISWVLMATHWWWRAWSFYLSPLHRQAVLGDRGWLQPGMMTGRRQRTSSLHSCLFNRRVAPRGRLQPRQTIHLIMSWERVSGPVVLSQLDVGPRGLVPRHTNRDGTRLLTLSCFLLLDGSLTATSSTSWGRTCT